MSNLSGARRKHHHHFFPVFQLDYFVDKAAGGVWAHDRRGRLDPNPKCLPPKAIAAEEDLYTGITSGGELSDKFETWLGQAVDGPAAAAFEPLLRGVSLTRAEMSAIARYVMARDLRTPKAQALALEHEKRAADAGLAALRRDLSGTRARIVTEGGPDFTEEELEYYLDTSEAEVTNNAFIAFIDRYLNTGAARLYAKSWLVLQAPIGARFLTSDLGIVKFRNGWHDPVPHTVAWIAKAEGWIMPLTPHFALVMAPGGDVGRTTARPRFVELVNRVLADQAEAFVFAADPLLWLKRSWGL
ncbi:MAG TPA: DUF4238 domain-containing protein [Gemmatimonadaceae bacterium]|nr:DUF4238 domain-containing protein [Gemmatimonadaceae bacterium]